MIDLLVFFTFLGSGLIAIVSSFIEAKSSLIKNLQKRKHMGLDKSEADITIKDFRHVTNNNPKLRDRLTPIIIQFLHVTTLLILLGGVFLIVTFAFRTGTIGNIEPNNSTVIDPSSPTNKDPINHQEDDIHSFVLKYNKLFKNNIEIDWESCQLDDDQRYYLDNALSESGISISYFDSDEEDIDWDMLNNDGIGYVLIRIGGRRYGTGEIYLDEKYREYMDTATKTGIKIGCYFYSQAISQAEADEEIEQIVNSVAKYKDVLAYPIGISLDMGKRVSDLSNEECIDLVKYMCIKLLQAGYTPMIIGNTEWYGQFPDGTFSGYLKLVSSKEPPQYMDNCIIWEYDENAENIVAGVKNAVELSVSVYGLLD